MEEGGDGRDSEKDLDPLFSISFQSESEFSSISCRRHFAPRVSGSLL